MISNKLYSLILLAALTTACGGTKPSFTAQSQLSSATTTVVEPNCTGATGASGSGETPDTATGGTAGTGDLGGTGGTGITGLTGITGSTGATSPTGSETGTPGTDPTPIPHKLSCGDILYHSVVMTEDLDCTGFTGRALSLAGEGVTLDGDGHRLITPDASVAVWVSGNAQTVTDLEITGGGEGYGILAYQAPCVELTDNIIVGKGFGIYVNAGGTPTQDILIADNDLSHSKYFALRLSGGETMVNPVVQDNDLSFAEYSLHLNVKSMYLDGEDGNDFTGSHHGIHAVYGSYDFRGLDLTSIEENGIFVYSAKSLKVTDSDVSGSAGVGLGILSGRVESTVLTRVKANGRSIGMYFPLSKDENFVQNIHILESVANQNTVGIYLTTDAPSSFGNVGIMNTTAINNTDRNLIILGPVTGLLKTGNNIPE